MRGIADLIRHFTEELKKEKLHDEINHCFNQEKMDLNCCNSYD